ncbi:hypothetical protein CHGG_00701 [Chaetomium globosum CBS 148.51]|uniref:DUF6536 domain-containing protein n=1 Tax=Chaetomium globosum (strain ATCC 6205 / CBS 148.51 / DSM 1962 / NBRC 6347 / NRRL 1970) TaxID=306901 RepID=Q2HGF3_CHAGB|nr:uncharacterized protein CHGG_00701 [Chaetomium globosum CBS 148.51]EAQ92466.1 hypothetical protein CHGG_00701 [Chaetomium globosum CBS 148.51]
METVIPPRDHGPSTYRYTWDENGEVTQVASPIVSIFPPHQPHHHHHQQQQQQQQHQQPPPPPPQPRQRCMTSPAARLPHNTMASSWWSRNGGVHCIGRRWRIFLRGFSLVRGGGGGGGGFEVGSGPRPRSGSGDGLGWVGAELGRVDSREGVPVGVGEEQRFFLGEGVRGVGEKGDVGGGGVGGGDGRGGWRAWRGGGWRAGVAMIVLATLVILITGFVCLVVAISGVNAGAGGSAVFEGSCGSAAAVDWGLHAVVNVFVVVLVGGANYAFQVLSSPTREEVEAVHQRGGWVGYWDPVVAESSAYRGWPRVASRCASSDGGLYANNTAPDYKAAIVSEALLRGAAFSSDISNDSTGFSRPDLLAIQQQAVRGELIRLPTPTCIDQFSGAFETEYSAVLLVSNLDTLSLTQKSGGIVTNPISGLAPERSSILYCLAQPAPAPTCEVNLNAPLLGTVALLNSIALVATAALLFKRPSSFRPLATLGDAIASFLEDPDPTTQGACLLSKTDIWRGRWPLEAAKYWVPQTHYWFRSVSLPRWMGAFLLWVICTSLTAAGIGYSTSLSPSNQLTPFGTTSAHALLSLPPATPAAAAAVLASLPQLLLAFLYLTTNALLTTYHLSHESSLFATGPARPLRVSASSARAVGAQSTSLHLTLPRALSGLLMAFFAGLAFVLRQSCFAVAVRLVDVPVSRNALPADSDDGDGAGGSVAGWSWVEWGGVVGAACCAGGARAWRAGVGAASCAAGGAGQWGDAGESDGVAGWVV